MEHQATALSFILHVSFDIMRVSDYIDSNLLVDINFSLKFILAMRVCSLWRG